MLSNEASAKAFIDDFMSEEVIEQVLYVMSRCNETVKLVAIYDDSESPCKQQAALNVRYFIQKLAEITDIVTAEVFKKGDQPDIEAQINTEYYPVLALFNESGKYAGVCFHGFPGGFELEAFILAIYNLASPGQSLAAELVARIQALDYPLNLKVCVSLSCNLCPELVQTANRFAILNSLITTETFDLECFAEMSDLFEIPSVPAVIINNNEVLFGRKDVRKLLEVLEVQT